VKKALALGIRERAKLSTKLKDSPTMSNPYAAPDAELGTPSEDGEYQPKMFSLTGRIGRIRYLAWSFLLGTLAYLPMMIFMVIMGQNLADGADSTLASIISIPTVILALAVSFILARRRLHDLNRSGWFSLLFIVPLINIFVGLYLVFWPGTLGSNRFGLQPTKNGTAAWIVLVLVFVAMIGVIAAIALPAYQDYIQAATEAAAEAANQ